MLILTILAVWSFDLAAMPVKGTVTADGQPHAGVAVTDGYTFTKSNDKGEFAFEANDAAFFISIVTPSGFHAPVVNGSAQIYIPVDAKRKSYNFQLERFEGSDKEFELIAIGDPQPKTSQQLAEMRRVFLPRLQKAVDKQRPQIAMMLGDIVWDAPDKLDSMKLMMSELGIITYPVIGNHDHLLKGNTDDECTANFRRVYGPTYYAFDIADTHFIVLDNIKYHGNKQYEEEVDDRQLAWLENYLKIVPANSRICIAQHAPVVKPWRNMDMATSTQHLLRLLKAYEVHFITGHTHINFNTDITDYAMEHNVAQINGNLWRDPINRDGTPLGVQVFNEKDGKFSWQYRVFDQPQSYQMRVWNRGELKERKHQVVAKIWNWDPHWSVVWYEDGTYRGSMPRISIDDPDYVCYLETLKEQGKPLTKLHQPLAINSYFWARPSKSAKQVKIVATDSFGESYTQTIKLK